jgi:O-antigen/teichoic acid export membrane protein
MDKVAAAELIGKVCQVAFVLFAIKKDLGFSWIVAALLVNMLVSFSLVYAWSKKYLRFQMQFDFTYWKHFLKESAPIGVASMITFAYFKMDTILLSVMKSSTEVGIYNAAGKVLENITFFPAMIIGLIFPLLAKEIFKNKERFQDIANKTFKVFLLMVFPLVVGVVFLAEDIIQVIGGGGFAESAAVLRILVFALAFIFFGNFYNSLLIAGNLQKRLMLILGLVAGVNVALNLFFIPRFSYLASAYISVLTEFLVVAITAGVAAKKIKYFPQVEKIGSILAATGLMATFLFVFRGSNFIFLGLTSATIYFLALWILRAVKTEELMSLISKKGVQEYESIS